MTVAEVMRSAGYATKIIGKWHLGDQPEFLPTRQGFDEYFGIPYSDDMTRDKRPEEWPELPLMRDEVVVEAPAERDTLTRRYTEEAIEWIRRKKGGPFFLYLPHAMPGSTQAAHSSVAFQGKSANGKWGDSVEELDWSQGEILRVLKEEGLAENTLVVVTSDHGMPFPRVKGHTFDLAHRVPLVVRWPQGIVHPGRRVEAFTSLIDFAPTVLDVCGLAGLDFSGDADEIGARFYFRKIASGGTPRLIRPSRIAVGSS
jgi:arylsulfatase A-like enzyme